MAMGENLILFFGPLGQATPPDRGNSIGTFTMDETPSSYIAIYEAAGQGEDTYLNDEQGGGGSNFSADQIVAGAPSDGKIATTVSRFNVFDDADNVVGKVYELNIDQNVNSRAYETDEYIGYVLVGNCVEGESYIISQQYAVHKDTSDFQYSAVSLPPHCFTPGTLMSTPTGEVPNEELDPGDLILTLDNGYQALRWIGSTTQRAIGNHAPDWIKKTTLDNTRNLCISTDHRRLSIGWKTELHFANAEGLGTAKSPIKNCFTISERPHFIEYDHLLFDTHQIIKAEGSLSESSHPGKSAWDGFGHETREAILPLSPELERCGRTAYGPPYRTCLKRSEGRFLSKSYPTQGERRCLPHATRREPARPQLPFGQA